MSLNVPHLPVFAFPTCLKFYLASKNTHTQVLSLYSPYVFPVKYKIHCHASSWVKYIVPNPEGTIPGQSNVDLIVTHKNLVPTNCNIIDRFKIIITDPVTNQIIGIKFIEAILLPGEQNRANTYSDEDFQFPNSNESTSSRRIASIQQNSLPHSLPKADNKFFFIIIVVCAIILFLPTEIEIIKPSSSSTTNIPSYLHVSHKVQLFAALLLGVFLCILVRS